MNVAEILQKHNASRNNYYPETYDTILEHKKMVESVMDAYRDARFIPEWQFQSPTLRYILAKYQYKCKHENSISLSLVLMIRSPTFNSIGAKM